MSYRSSRFEDACLRVLMPATVVAWAVFVVWAFWKIATLVVEVL